MAYAKLMQMLDIGIRSQRAQLVAQEMHKRKAYRRFTKKQDLLLELGAVLDASDERVDGWLEELGRHVDVALKANGSKS